MRIVIAIGGNALLGPGQAPTAQNQLENMRLAASALAQACAGNEVAIVHGNGPQVGLLALKDESYAGLEPYPLDILGAESQGMLGYVIAQCLQNANPHRDTVAVLTRTRIDPSDDAFSHPTKPIGPTYSAEESADLSRHYSWSFGSDRGQFRRVVPSPAPVEIVELAAIERLLNSGVVVVCAGGGGIPVRSSGPGALAGSEAVIDKDLTASLLACELEADRLIILTNVEGVYLNWGDVTQRMVRQICVEELQSHTFSEGSMGPKVEAAIKFVESTGRSAVIGALTQTDAVMAGRAGTLVSKAAPISQNAPPTVSLRPLK